ncbi:MAG: CotH kinase family protein, partial [Clostridiales bacterium]
DDEIFLQLESMIDIDNLMDFYITQLYFANTDFPENNNRMWRPRRQGAKWRWLFYDCEAGLHFAKSDKLLAYSNAPEDKENTPEWAVIILQQMLYNDSFQKQFYNRFISYMSNEFAPEVVIDKIHEYEKFYEPLMRDHIYRWNYPNCIDKWKENINVIEKFALQRPVYLNFQLQKLFEKPFSVYPNPSYGEFNIKFYGASTNKCYKIFDLSGNKIHEGEINDNDTFHFEKFLPVGIYLLQITMDQFFYIEKIIIQ